MQLEISEAGIRLVAFAILFAYWVMVFAILYHLARFGIGTQPKRLGAMFLLGSVILSSAYVVLITMLT